MRASETALNLIRQFEGFRAKPYRCPGGYMTVGYGHLMHSAETFKMLTRDQGERLLLSDVGIIERAVHRLIRTPLLQHQWDALVSFTFNIGPGHLQRSTLRQCVNRGHHAYVPAELLKWVRSNGKVLPGLLRRRAIEAALYQGSFSANEN